MNQVKLEGLEDDPLIEALIDAKGKSVEIVAFGILYVGILRKVDLSNGTIQIADGDDQAVLEIERIESFCMTTP